MGRWQALIRVSIAATALAASAMAVAAGEGSGEAKPEPAAEKASTCDGMTGWFASQCIGLREAWREKRPMVLLSGYTWHDPATYDDDKLESFNAAAWGGGFGFGRNDAKGDHYSWYALAFKDSHYNWSYQAGWSWMTYWPDRADFAVGLGYTAFIMQRPDIASGWPFPAALPLASVKAYNVEVLGTYIPKLNGGINHGDVAYFFARYQF